MTHHVSWLPVHAHPRLEGDEVHLWRIDLRDEKGDGSDVLTAGEMERARRMTVEVVRRRFVSSRSALRRLLAGYLEQHPHELIFQTGPHGKPALSGATLSFNLSHASDEALLAVTRRSPIGVDVERVSSARMTNDIAARFFSPHEQKQLAECRDGDRLASFFRIWSRKEAVVKALGEGLACPLDSFDVSANAQDARLLAFRRPGIDIAQWTLRDLPAADGYVAALAVMGACGALRFFQHAGS